MTSKIDQAKELIAKVSARGLSSLEAGQDLVVDLGIDSSKALELLVELEEALGIEITDEEAARFETVGDVLTYVEALP
jgi:acyl carrier protein